MKPSLLPIFLTFSLPLSSIFRAVASYKVFTFSKYKPQDGVRDSWFDIWKRKKELTIKGKQKDE